MPQGSPPVTRRLILLGSTGSIGTSTLEVVEHLHRAGEFRFEVVGLAAGNNVSLLAEQARRFNVSAVATCADEPVEGVRQCFRGPDAARELIERTAQPGDLVLAAMVGYAGLAPTLAAIERGCDIALANKETLVAAGSLVMPAIRRGGLRILPVDSEHSGVFQCLCSGRTTEDVRRVVLTASGGPFRTWTRAQMREATVEQALKHPTWSMGPKVTIDSASLMNKALEIIEAHWLFDLPAEKIDAIMHPQSLVHSFVEFLDGSVIAQLSPPDMKTPIQLALTWPARVDGCSKQLDWRSLSRLDFQPIDTDVFPAVRLAYDVIRAGGTTGACFNAANEIAVQAFLDRRIRFGDIGEMVREAVASIRPRSVRSLQDVSDADAEARELTRARIARVGAPAAVLG